MNRMIKCAPRLRGLRHLLIAILCLSAFLCLKLPAEADSEVPDPYQVKTRWYERFPDGRHATVEFARIAGTGEETVYANINYILEREAFRMAECFLRDRKPDDNVFQAIAAMQNQYLYVSYEVEYQDDQLLSVRIYGETEHFTEDDEICFTSDSEDYFLFDMRTGRQLKLSDFVELDRRIIDYRAENYEVPAFDRPTHISYYSFMDAFEVYEEEKYDHHREIHVEEALEMLENGEIHRAIRADKELMLYYYISSAGSFLHIPYSYIADFAHY